MTGPEIGSLLLKVILGSAVALVVGALLWAEISNRVQARRFRRESRKKSVKIKREWDEKYGGQDALS